MYSHTALKIYAALREDIIKTNAQFWREFSDSSKIEAMQSKPKIMRKNCGMQIFVCRAVSTRISPRCQSL